MSNNYFNCKNCLWYGHCDNDNWDIDHMGRTLNAFCGDYSPIDDNDEIIAYQADLDMRQDLYLASLPEFQ